MPQKFTLEQANEQFHNKCYSYIATFIKHGKQSNIYDLDKQT